MIQIPDTSKGQKAMILVKGSWCAVYYEDGKQRRKCLNTDHKTKAVLARNRFFQELASKGATVKPRRTPQEKLQDKPDLYIYSRPPYQFKVKGKVLCESWCERDVREARDKWLEENDAGGMARELAAQDSESPTRDNG